MTYGSGDLPLAWQNPTWEIWLERYDGSALFPLTDMVIAARVYVALNGLWSFALELSLEKLHAAGYKDIPTDSIIEFRRKHGTVKSFSFYKRKTVRTKYRIIIAGFGLNHLLKRRVIAYYTGSSYAKKTGYLDDLAKAIVRENMTSDAVNYADGSADTARDLGQVLDFTVQVDTSNAVSDTMAFAWDNVYETLVKICDNSAKQGTRLFFEIVRTGDTSFQFQTLTNTYGIDRRGAQTFGEAFGNLGNTELTLDRGTEVNYLYVTGKGVEEYRKIEPVSNDDLINASPLNRMEGTYNASTADDDALAGIGARVLERSKPLRLYKGELQDSEGARYGVDWDLGDLLDAQDGDEEFEIMITGLEFSLSDNQTTTRGRFMVLDE